MKHNILVTMGILVIIGFAALGVFGIAAGIFLSSLAGIVYGTVKKDKQFVRWSVAALAIDLLCIAAFYACLASSDM